jgi:hypothetical protein
MKLNWKVLIALGLVGLVVFWAVNSLRPLSYVGTDLTFPVSGGLVTVNNPSDTPVAVQLSGAGSRIFNVTSSIDGVSGASIREGSGSTGTNIFAFDLPPGESTFSVARGNDINFTATTDTRLSALVQPAAEGETRLTLISATLAILALLFYISNTTEHRWIKSILGRADREQAPVVAVPVVDTHGQGRTTTSYGDNRARTE